MRPNLALDKNDAGDSILIPGNMKYAKFLIDVPPLHLETSNMVTYIDEPFAMCYISNNT